MVVVFITSIITLILSWIVSIGGLFLAIKEKEKNQTQKSKVFYYAMIISDYIGNVSWYLAIVSFICIVVKCIASIK